MAKHTAGTEQATSATVTLEALEAQLAPLAEPLVREALLRETSHAGAEPWLDAAQWLLSGLLKPAQPLDARGLAQAREELVASVREGVPAPDAEELRTHTRKAVRVLVRGWLSLLQEAAGQQAEVLLDESFLPSSSLLDESSEHAFEENLAPLALGWPEARTLLGSLRASLGPARYALAEVLELHVGPEGSSVRSADPEQRARLASRVLERSDTVSHGESPAQQGRSRSGRG